jgi:hypothetical protein
MKEEFNMGKLIDNRLQQMNTILNPSLSPTANNYQQYAQSLLQQKIDSEWAYAPNKYTIQEELERGSKIFTNTEVRLGHVVDKPSTSSRSSSILGDDIRNIIFSNISHQYGLGYMYQFDDNYWLCNFSDKYRYNTASCTIRRCNNTLNWYDVDENGKTILIQEPCIVDYNLLRDRITFDDMNLLNGDAHIMVQNNQITKKIFNNQRFIFDGQVFKLQSVNNFIREKTMVKGSAPLLYFNAYKDEIASDDDLVNNIANGLNITPNTSNIVIDPIINKIFVNNTKTFSVYKNVNGVNQSDTFTITASEVPSEYYTLNIIDGNHFSITNNEQYLDNDLVITCIDNVDSSVQKFNVELGGAW